MATLGLYWPDSTASSEAIHNSYIGKAFEQGQIGFLFQLLEAKGFVLSGCTFNPSIGGLVK